MKNFREQEDKLFDERFGEQDIKLADSLKWLTILYDTKGQQYPDRVIMKDFLHASLARAIEVGYNEGYDDAKSGKQNRHVDSPRGSP